MTRRDHSLVTALCVSLVAHVALLLVLVGRYVASAARFQPPGVSRVERSSAIYLAQPAPPADLIFGDQNGAGEAANTSPGEQPMTGRDAGQVQAFLSRDPVGAGHAGDEPSMSVLPRGEELASAAAAAAAAARMTAPADEDVGAFGISQRNFPQTIPRTRLDEFARSPAAQGPRVNELDKEWAPVSPASDAPAAADPAIMSDSESDPFAHGNSVEFRDGRVDVRFGRKVKTVRPRLSLAAKYDLLAMQFPRMVVRVHVDAGGEPRLVEIFKSSGSQSADQEVKVALYQWWFEPPKNLHGVAMADVVEFPIIWR